MYELISRKKMVIIIYTFFFFSSRKRYVSRARNTDTAEHSCVAQFHYNLP